MDGLFEGLGKLLGTFKDPTQVVLLLVCLAEGFGLYRLVKFLTDNYKTSIENDLRNAQALEGVQRILEKVVANGGKS